MKDIQCINKSEINNQHQISPLFVFSIFAAYLFIILLVFSTAYAADFVSALPEKYHPNMDRSRVLG